MNRERPKGEGMNFERLKGERDEQGEAEGRGG